MSGMEPEAQDFLKRIVQTVSVGMLFLLLHMTFGLYLNWGFFEGTPRLGNIIYYIIFLASFAGLIYFYYRFLTSWPSAFLEPLPAKPNKSSISIARGLYAPAAPFLFKKTYIPSRSSMARFFVGVRLQRRNAALHERGG